MGTKIRRKQKSCVQAEQIEDVFKIKYFFLLVASAGGCEEEECLSAFLPRGLEFKVYVYLSFSLPLSVCVCVCPFVFVDSW